MIDTVKLQYNLEIPKEFLRRWVTKSSVEQLTGATSTKHVANIVLNPEDPKFKRVMIKATYFEQSYTGEPLVTIELSVPKLVFGNNYQEVFDLDEAAQIIDKTLVETGYFPDLPSCNEAKLGRLDACYNHVVADDLPHYLKAIAKLEYPHRRAAEFKYQGVQFKSKHNTAKFYDKGVESRRPEAKGLLRQEATIMKTKNIELLFGRKKPTFGNLSIEMLQDVLEKDLDRLKLKDAEILTTDQMLERICCTFGETKRGLEVYGLYKAREERGKNYLSAISGTNKQKINRRQRQLYDLGIAMATTDGPDCLPPLTIDLKQKGVEMNQSP